MKEFFDRDTFLHSYDSFMDRLYECFNSRDQFGIRLVEIDFCFFVFFLQDVFLFSESDDDFLNDKVDEFHGQVISFLKSV